MLWALRDDDRPDRRLRVRLRQPVDAAQLQAPAQHAASATRFWRRCRRCAAATPSTPTCACATTGEPWVEEVNYDTPVRRRLHARHVRAAHGQARRRPGGVPHRRDHPAPDGGRAAQLRRRGGARPARARVGNGHARGPAGAPRRGAAASRRAAAAARKHRARARADRRRPGLRAHGRAAPRAGRARLRSWTRWPRTCGPVFRSTGATLEVGELPEVDGDRRQLRRVFQNLVGNAIKFRAEAPPRDRRVGAARQRGVDRDRARQRRGRRLTSTAAGSSASSRG